MNIIIGDWFWLPRVRGDVFKTLINEAGLKYDKTKGFQITSDSNLNIIKSIIKDELKENMDIMLKCFICENPIECSICRYYDACESFRIYNKCICSKCETDDVSTIYAMHFTQLVE